MKKYRYTIRAHHGMCLAFFNGKGYSEDFVKNMQSIKTALEENPFVKIVSETEDICACCPENIGKKCLSYEKVLGYDNGVLQYCGLKSGDILPYSDFEKLVKEKILDAGNREKICGNCQWSEICR